MSKLFSLNSSDYAKGLVVAVLAAVFAYLSSLLSNPNFDLMTVDWGSLMKVAITAGIAYLGKNFFSTSDGKVLGKIG